MMLLKQRYSFSLLIALVSSFFISCEHDSLPDQILIRVNFADKTDNLISMNGFQHGLSSDKPRDELINPLKPYLFRSGVRFFDATERRKNIGGREIFVISGAWAQGPGKRFSVMPYDDYDFYIDFVNQMLDSVGNNVIFDVWNEPDVAGLWPGTQEQFYECFKITHDLIRAKYGNDAVISGPSAHWIPNYINEFMSFCRTADIQLDVLSIHELYSEDYLHIRDHVSYLRKRYVDSPAYQHLGIKEVHVSEYGFNGSHLSPSMILGYLYDLEQAEADGACRACWQNENGRSTCWNGTLGGLLTQDNDFLPRSAWWAHKVYADGLNNRVQSFSNVPFVATFASRAIDDRPEAARVIAVNAHTIASLKELSVIVSNVYDLPFIKNGDQNVIVRVYQIPDSGNNALEELLLNSEEKYQIQDGGIELQFFDVPPLTNYIIEIERGT